MTKTTRTATYKGRTYRLLFSGPTKFGRRAHLEFLDGSKSFWVDAGLVSESAAPPARRRRDPGDWTDECGRRRGSLDSGRDQYGNWHQGDDD